MKEKDLIEFAIELPKATYNYKDFSKDLKRNQLTPIGKVKLDLFYAFNHLTKNSKSQNRFYLTGGFSATLKNPLIVFKTKYEYKNKEVDSHVFYKPFLKNNKIIHLYNMSIDINGKLYQKTFYNSEGFKRLNKFLLESEIEYVHPKIDKKLFETDFNKSRGVVRAILTDSIDNVKIKELKDNTLLDKIVQNFETEHNILPKVSKKIREKR